jgi:nuclease HARBI1
MLSIIFFYRRIAGLIGSIDGTHVPLYRPTNHSEPEVFRCRKGYFSNNCQIVADPDHNIYNVVARCPGSTHDSRIFHESRLKSHLDSQVLSGFHLGDSSYPCLS